MAELPSRTGSSPSVRATSRGDGQRRHLGRLRGSRPARLRGPGAGPRSGSGDPWPRSTRGASDSRPRLAFGAPGVPWAPFKPARPCGSASSCLCRDRGRDYRWFVSWGWKREGRGLSHPAGSGGAAMTKRLPCPPAPGPLEGYAAQFGPLFARLAQRRGLRAYLQGLLLPRDRNKTLTCLVGAEPVVGAQQGAVQGLQFFLSESPWDHEQLNQRRVELLLGDPATAPHDHGVMVIDDTGDRKAGTKTANVARQYLGSVGKTDNGIVAVTSLWASERVYWPVHVVPYTPACRLPKGKRDPGFRTSRSWPPSLSKPPARPGSGSGRWWPTASTATTRASPRRWGRQGSPTCWRSSPARASGRRPTRPTPRARRPPSSPGKAPSGPGTGPSSPAGSATGTPRPGGRRRRRCPPPAGARTGGCGWWWRPPTRPGCRS